jgi:glycosyltransferase involved in cell wall biosynthesis
MPKISIAIPTWEVNKKGEEFLDDLLRTIEIQTFTDFEVVISDHCVDDYLLPKVKEFQNKFEIKYFKNKRKRGNSPANLNNAIKKCSGEVIKIMFQDDFFYDDEALEKIYYILMDSNKNWLLNGTNHTKNHGHSFYWEMYPRFNDNLLRGVNSVSSPSVVAFKKDCTILFDEDLKYLMDVDYYYGMREKCGEPIYYDDILVSNRFPHENSISSSINNKEELLIIESEYCFKKYGVDE